MIAGKTRGSRKLYQIMWYSCKSSCYRSTSKTLTISSVTEQPLKIPFVASIILYANEQKADIAAVIIAKAGRRLQETLEAAEWRSFKLILRFLAYMTGLFEGEGVMPLLDELFNKAADLQTESNDDVRRDPYPKTDSSLTHFRHSGSSL
jgi:hypothetical protein